MARRIAPKDSTDTALESDAERELRGMELRLPRPFGKGAVAARVAEQEDYRRDFFHLLHRLRGEGRPETAVLARMRGFSRDRHPVL